MIPVVLMSYVQQSDAASRVLYISVGAFIVGEFTQVLRVRPGATRANLGAEALFRAMFFGGILLIPIGRAVAPGAAIRGGVWTFALGVLIGWLGLLLRWWSFVTWGSTSQWFSRRAKTSRSYREFATGRARLAPFLW